MENLPTRPLQNSLVAFSVMSLSREAHAKALKLFRDFNRALHELGTDDKGPKDKVIVQVGSLMDDAASFAETKEPRKARSFPIPGARGVALRPQLMPHQKRPGTLPFSAYLAVIVLVAALPVLGFSAILVNNLLNSERTASEQLMQKTADEVALAFDQEVIATVRVLEALAASDRLLRADLRAFHGELQNVLASEPRWLSIRLHRASDSAILLDAQVPYGSPMRPTAEPESLRSVIAKGVPQVGRRRPPRREKCICSRFGCRCGCRCAIRAGRCATCSPP